jgi:transposase
MVLPFAVNGLQRIPECLAHGGIKINNPEEAEALYEQGRETVVFFILKQSRHIEQLEKELSFLRSKEDNLPATPSGMIPVFKKPSLRRHQKSPGQKAGHPGTRRAPPEKIDHRQEHTLKVCPECQGQLSPPVEQRRRYIEDIPQISVEVTEHIINRYYCQHCRKIIEPKVLEALPGCQIGLNALILSAYWHYLLGITVPHIIEVFNAHLHFPISSGGLIQMWRNLGRILWPVYEEIREVIKERGKLHSDETGWRVNGKTHWLWCFSDEVNTYYQIERCRGSPVLLEFLGEDYDGVLISDFFSAYDKVKHAERQVCLSHLFRELVVIDKRNKSSEWVEFHKKLKRLLRDSLRLKEEQGGIAAEVFTNRKGLLHQRLEEMWSKRYEDADCQRLAKRLGKHRARIFTFLEHLDVPPDNNQAEREIRPAVIMRKNSNGNRSVNGAETQAVLMSIFRTLKRRNLSPLETLGEILRQYLKDNITPSLNLLHSAK